MNAGHVHTLVLMLIASKILELSVPQKSTAANNDKIPLKTIEIGLAKEYLYVGDVRFVDNLSKIEPYPN